VVGCGEAIARLWFAIPAERFAIAYLRFPPRKFCTVFSIPVFHSLIFSPKKI
jgi:hypothetical protein